MLSQEVLLDSSAQGSSEPAPAQGSLHWAREEFKAMHVFFIYVLSQGLSSSKAGVLSECASGMERS